MNSDDHIHRALQQQADQIHEGPLTMSDIKGRARSIQRRRTLAAAAGAAAVVAIIAPVGVIAMNNGDKNPAQPSTNSVNPTLPTQTSGAAPVYTVDLKPPAEGTTGAEVGVPIWMQGSISDVHGSTIDVGMPVRSFVQDANGNWAGMTMDNGHWSWTSFGNTGAVEASEQSDNDRVAVTPDGQSFAWISKVAPDSPAPKQWQLTLAGPHAKVWNLDLQDNSGAFVVGILPDWSVVYAIGGDKVMIAHQDGNISRLPGAISARSASTATGLIAAETKYNDDGTSCWALMDASGDRKVESCDYALGQFNADGSRIVGQDSGADGNPGRLYQLDTSSLEPLATFKAPQGAGFWSDTAWNGDTLLALVYDYPSQTWNISFLSTDGIQLLRSGGKTGNDVDPPYLFGAGPLTPIAP
jgi:hypothetical protein